VVETYEHAFLKDLAVLWLREQGYLWIGKEIGLSHFSPRPSYDEERRRFNQLTLGHMAQTWENRFICDCVGVRYYYSGTHYLYGCGIEAKATQEDYLRGFCFDRLNLHYIIAPRGIVPKGTLPKAVGLLEVHDPHLEQINELWSPVLVGVEVRKRAYGYGSSLADEKKMELLVEQIGRHASMHHADLIRKNLPLRPQPEFLTPRFKIQERLSRGKYAEVM